MRNLDGSQSLLKLLQMIIHLGEVNFRIICSSSKHYRGYSHKQKILKGASFPTRYEDQYPILAEAYDIEVVSGCPYLCHCFIYSLYPR